ncbi:trypsin-like serine protease [Rubrobacter marinus]|uniref:Trypsin-like serine protease n=1 Tax=Rubrobacter marinus TaxID=2653852 RepID=A0A6G8PZT9_9ACTN|nr:trypsin-like peptidase domain-containing protein [Rubrobacter marinus]QIN79754.1 trypsin-like serine protease [Rubrobacter marinus]
MVSAIIGGLIATVLVYLGVSNIDGGSSGDVTITEAPGGATPTGSVDPGSAEGPSVRDVYNQDGPGVVTVEVASREVGPGGGSGFVIDKQGHVVTNQHVVDGADSVSVAFASGARERARVVGEDPSTDVAVLQVDAPEETLKPLTLGDSEALGVGDPVIAIGNPLDVGISVTTGIVSGVGRPIKAPNNYTINGAVQTDAAINPGNSGGPLLDARGTVIGVNSQIFSETGGFQGVGFAVPINTVKSVVEQLIETGRVEHGFIGVRMFPVGVGELAAYSGRDAGRLSDEFGLPEDGAIVSEATRGGPADEAGLRGGEGREEEIAGLPVPIGDVITQVRGEPVSTPDDVIEVVNSLKPGDDLPLTVVTPGEEPREVTVRLGVQPPQ